VLGEGVCILECRSTDIACVFSCLFRHCSVVGGLDFKRISLDYYEAKTREESFYFPTLELAMCLLSLFPRRERNRATAPNPIVPKPTKPHASAGFIIWLRKVMRPISENTAPVVAKAAPRMPTAIVLQRAITSYRGISRYHTS
jgi:hypothetical protein